MSSDDHAAPFNLAHLSPHSALPTANSGSLLRRETNLPIDGKLPVNSAVLLGCPDDQTVNLELCVSWQMSTDLEDEKRQGFWFDSLIHAREWITGAVTMNIINYVSSKVSLPVETCVNMLTSSQLNDTFTTNDETKYLLSNYNFYFIPIVNPDGYIYSWSNDRFWRKSRNINKNTQCVGTDLNRNFNYAWGSKTSRCDHSSRRHSLLLNSATCSGRQQFASVLANLSRIWPSIGTGNTCRSAAHP